MEPGVQCQKTFQLHFSRRSKQWKLVCFVCLKDLLMVNNVAHYNGQCASFLILFRTRRSLTTLVFVSPNIGFSTLSTQRSLCPPLLFLFHLMLSVITLPCFWSSLFPFPSKKKVTVPNLANLIHSIISLKLVIRSFVSSSLDCISVLSSDPPHWEGKQSHSFLNCQ